jgi:dystonin
LEKAEEKFRGMRPLGTDIETVKQQIEQLKAFKAEVDPHMIKVETLNRYENLSFHVVSFDFYLFKKQF